MKRRGTDRGTKRVGTEGERLHYDKGLAGDRVRIDTEYSSPDAEMCVALGLDADEFEFSEGERRELSFSGQARFRSPTYFRLAPETARAKKQELERFYFNEEMLDFQLAKILVHPSYSITEKSMWDNLRRELTTPITFPIPLLAGLDQLLELLNTKNQERKIIFLQGQLRTHLPHVQLFRFGAGCLIASVASLLIWAQTGIGVPLHPIFSIVLIPLAAGLIGMSFLVKRSARVQSDSAREST